MTKLVARPINDQSWILFEWGNRVGVLSSDSHSWTVVDRNKISKFSSIEELQQNLNWQIEFEQAEDKDNPTDKIDNLPIKHTSPQKIEREPYISYTRSEKSNLRFAAGFWGVKFPHGWVPTLSPKVDTLNSYDKVGPFATSLAMKAAIKQRITREGAPK